MEALHGVVEAAPHRRELEVEFLEPFVRELVWHLPGFHLVGAPILCPTSTSSFCGSLKSGNA